MTEARPDDCVVKHCSARLTMDSQCSVTGAESVLPHDECLDQFLEVYKFFICFLYVGSTEYTPSMILLCGYLERKAKCFFYDDFNA